MIGYIVKIKENARCADHFKNELGIIIEDHSNSTFPASHSFCIRFLKFNGYWLFYLSDIEILSKNNLSLFY